MASFAVRPADLEAAGLTLQPGVGNPALTCGAAAAQTPAAGAWSEFVETGSRALTHAHESVSDLSRALTQSAQIYEIANQVSASNLTPITS